MTVYYAKHLLVGYICSTDHCSLGVGCGVVGSWAHLQVIARIIGPATVHSPMNVPITRPINSKERPNILIGQVRLDITAMSQMGPEARKRTTENKGTKRSVIKRDHRGPNAMTNIPMNANSPTSREE